MYTSLLPGIPMYIDNEVDYGYMLIRIEHNTVNEEVTTWQEYYAETLLPAIVTVPKSQFLHSKQQRSKLGFDEVCSVIYWQIFQFLAFN